ncbi:MAG: long-chain-fatty-acid--CoA ligase [Pseudomonadota bacterium]
MQGLMMDSPLLISSILSFAAKNHPDVEIVSELSSGERHRYRYADANKRIAQLAHGLGKLGVEPGDRVGTIAWNDFRHFEIYYATSCSGAVCHTINPRLFGEQLTYIINHAEDAWLFVDPMFVPLVEGLAGSLTTVKGIVVMCGADELPDSKLDNVHAYESLIAGEPTEFDWPKFDEDRASSLCYTSGTTGDPKGVLYSHRSTVLHAMSLGMVDSIGFCCRDSVLAVVPMFHVNAWGTPYGAAMVGAKLVFPGPKMGDPETLQDLIESENVTLALGVPTIWLGLLTYLEKTGKGLGSLKRTVVGGAACPPSIMQTFSDRYGVRTMHGWGMTEMSPLGTINTPKPFMDQLDFNDRFAVEVKQGHGLFGVEMKITDDDNNELPWDGSTFGSLKVRGPWICDQYFRMEKSKSHDPDGWFPTGDVSTIDANGYMQIVDRTKDVIKSGGEWVSSVELENVAMAHASVAEAAVIGIPHPKWSERPLLIVVAKEGATINKEALLSFFDGKVASWWIPEDVAQVEELPHTATGKVKKLALREQFKDYQVSS